VSEGPSQSEICGLQVSPICARDQKRWEELLHATLHPATRQGSSWHKEIWELYDNATYFHLSHKSPADFELLREPFETASKKIADHPEIGCQVWLSEQGIEAALSITKVYHRTWLGYQMARRQNESFSGRQILRDIHLHAYNHAQRDPNLRWLLGYIQANARWSRYVHYEYPARIKDTGKSDCIRFRAVEVSTNQTNAANDGQVDIDTPKPAELDLIVETICKTRGAAYVDALDLCRERIDLQGVKTAWKKAGLMRDRQILVARIGGKIKAAAILETAEAGVHVYGLMDLLRYVPLAKDADAALPALLEAARTWFRELGKSFYVYFCEHPFDFSALPQVQDLGLADLTLVHVDMLPDFLEYIVQVTAPNHPDKQTRQPDEQ
jgi:hypothetical protein